MPILSNQFAVRGPITGGGCGSGYGSCTDAWEYNKFRHRAFTLGEVNKIGQSEYHVFDSWPAHVGSFDEDIDWEVHGVRLAPRVTTGLLDGLTEIFGLRDDATAPEYTVYPQGRFLLDPEVALVPVRVIQLYVPGDPYHDDGWFSRQSADVLFDDGWKAHVDVNGDPFNSPDFIVGSWTHRRGCVDSWCTEVGHNIQPDRIFDECGVQFRLVEYVKCPVSYDVFWDTTQTNCNTSTGLSRVRGALLQCGALEHDAAIEVALAGSLVTSAQQCVGGHTLGIYSPQSDLAVIAHAGLFSTSGVIVAHELGHALGLAHAKPPGVCPPKQLMCGSDAQMSVDVVSGDCTKAHTNGLIRQENFLWDTIYEF